MVIDRSENPSHELHARLRRTTHWKTLSLRFLAGLCLLVAVVWLGRDVAHEIKALEAWVAGQGVWGRVAFVGMIVVLTSVFVPDTLLAVAAGALFGLGWGTLLTVLGSVTTAAVDFLAARTLLRPRIESMLEQHPKLRAIRAAANDEGIRLQLLLRLAPINPVSVSYVLGASGVRFSTFLIATVGLIPALFAEVYFGYLASHVTQVAGNVGDPSRLHTGMTVFSFVVCIVLIVYISRIATRALAAAEGGSAADAATAGS
jgi:uncharacterized membrane protein YdjX (TVP38/TMEM64 family)